MELEKKTNDIDDESEIKILDTHTDQNPCPFRLNLEKSFVDGKWRVSYLNSYHNHIFKKKVMIQTNNTNNRPILTDEEMFN
jgi:hypothetical protein